MKLKFTFKNPDFEYLAKSQATSELMQEKPFVPSQPSENLSKRQMHEEMDDYRGDVKCEVDNIISKFSKKYLQYSEFIDIEYDVETQEARIIPQNTQ